MEISISPVIKQQLPDQYREILDYFDSYDFDIFDHIRSHERLGMYFFCESREMESIKYPEGSVLFKLQTPNTSLFDSSDESLAFSIKDINELRSTHKIFDQIINAYFSKIDQQIFNFLKSKNQKTIINLNSEKIDEYINQLLEKITLQESLETSLEERSDLILWQGREIPILRFSKIYEPKSAVSEDLLCFCYAFSLLNEIFKNKMQAEDDLSLLSEKLNTVSNGLVVSKKSEVLWFNESFKSFDINPSDLVLWTDNKFQHGSRTFNCYISELGDGGKLISLSEVLTEDIPQSNEDLGIISSSIAHELNNPLGGISAAVDVLLLDDHKPGVVESLKEIKSTVLRCKNLVGTFLGFSRKELLQNNQVDCKLAIEQAYELLRFRLVENGLIANLKFHNENNLLVKCNSSVLTMVIYLVFNEFLTLLSHRRLVTNSQEKTLDIEVFETHHYLQFEVYPSFKIDSIKEQSLIQHLLQLIQLEAKIKNNKLILKML